MTVKMRITVIRFLTAVTFIVMIIINALANIIPINGLNTGQVSDYYKNLFAPAGYTFSIWGLIYILLAGYTIYQFRFSQGNIRGFSRMLFEKVGVYFSISSIANTLWIFSWHYRIIYLSMFFMLIILVCLILINQVINKADLSRRERIFIKLPFSVYFGWITVATIANATTLLVSLGWNRFGISEQLWTVIIISIGLIISVVTILKFRDISYGFVVIWAYLGIAVKHTTASGFSGQYPAVIYTTIICISLLFVVVAYIFVLNRKKLDNFK